MATTVTPVALSVTITENYELEGVAYGNSRVKTFDLKGQVDQRIMSVAFGEGAMTTIFGFSTVDAQGQGVKNNYAYFRITNLDDTNFIKLQISTTDTFWVKLKPGESFMLMDNEIDAIDSSTTFSAFQDIVSISADADTAACDIEYTVVTT
jgi:hypothetical protein